MALPQQAFPRTGPGACLQIAMVYTTVSAIPEKLGPVMTWTRAESACMLVSLGMKVSVTSSASECRPGVRKTCTTSIALYMTNTAIALPGIDSTTSNGEISQLRDLQQCQQL